MEEKCNHDINSESTTLRKSPKRFLVHPSIQDYFCPVCKKCFRYKKDSEGNLSLVKEEEK